MNSYENNVGLPKNPQNKINNFNLVKREITPQLHA